jgi:hypothetical protein
MLSADPQSAIARQQNGIRFPIEGELVLILVITYPMIEINLEAFQDGGWVE